MIKSMEQKDITRGVFKMPSDPGVGYEANRASLSLPMSRFLVGAATQIRKRRLD